MDTGTVADTDAQLLPVLSREDREAMFWVGEFARYGFTLSQAEVLAWQAGVDRHAVRVALIAAREKGTDPAFVFDAFS